MSHLKIPQSSKNEISNWKDFKQTHGWKQLCQIMEKNIQEADQIINTIGADSKAEYSKRDISVIKKQVMQEVLELPDNMIEGLSGTGEQPQEEMDAYEDDEEDAEEQLEEDSMETFVDGDF